MADRFNLGRRRSQRISPLFEATSETRAREADERRLFTSSYVSLRSCLTAALASQDYFYKVAGEIAGPVVRTAAPAPIKQWGSPFSRSES